MKKLVALLLGMTLFVTVLVPPAEARHRGAFVFGALSGAVVAGAVATSYHPSYYYPQPVVIRQPVYRPVYVVPSYTPWPYYGFSWGWYVR